MERYADYSYYRTEYEGTIPEILFDKLSIIATAMINRRTFSRIKKTDDIAKNCMCAVVDKLLEQQKQSEKQSEKVGTWSVTYSQKESTEKNKEITNIIEIYFNGIVDDNGTPLLYRGC